SYEFRLERVDHDIGFWILVDQVAAVDFARLRLVQLSRADYLEDLKARYPEGGPPNLLRTSTFPLGLQSGWTLGRDQSDGDDVKLSADPSAGGPSGEPALHVETEQPTTIWSAPFAVPLAFHPHCASLYAKGIGRLALTVFCDGRQLSRAERELTDEWQRVWVSFDPVLMAQNYCLRIEATSAYWLDAVQVNFGAEPTEYSRQMPCEVHLGLPESDASVARVQFADEPAEVLYYLTGSPGRLRVRAVNVYGEEQDVPVPGLDQRPRRGTLTCKPFPQRPYGPLRVEAWVEDNRGERISPYNELVINRLPRPRHWGEDAPDSPFGVHTLSTTRHNVMAKAIGANWTRLHDAGLEYLGWWWLERTPGNWTFRDKELYRYRRDHLMILGELGTAPEWASYYPGKPHNGYFDRYYQPKRMEDYANYVRTVCERYKGVISAYDVWNEPWIYSWWAVAYDESRSDRAGYVTSERPQADFVRLMRTAYETAKAVDPALRILGFNSTTGGGSAANIGGYEWTQGVLEAGGMAYCDVICYHQYISGKPGYPGDVVEQGFHTATGAIREAFGELPKPVWMTEGSAARDTIGPGFYKHILPFENTENVTETADRLCRYMVSLLAQGVEKLFLYSMHAQSALGFPSNWRVIVTPEGYLHPSGVAHGILAWYLEDTRFVKTLPLQADVTAYLFQARDGSRSVAVLSGHPGHREYTLPRVADLRVADLFGNPLSEDAQLEDTLIYLSIDAGIERLEALLK
ncbi:MAG: hypothetical protein ACUVX8_04235, partial [Candidatus Zipacnadales bacterium]